MIATPRGSSEGGAARFVGGAAGGGAEWVALAAAAELLKEEGGAALLEEEGGAAMMASSVPSSSRCTPADLNSIAGCPGPARDPKSGLPACIWISGQAGPVSFDGVLQQLVGRLPDQAGRAPLLGLGSSQGRRSCWSTGHAVHAQSDVLLQAALSDDRALLDGLQEERRWVRGCCAGSHSRAMCLL